jgi:ribonuclease BN (tRNA processing enzyme)
MAESLPASGLTGLRLTVVGCSGSYPGPDSPASCYLLEAESEGRIWRLLLDLGNGALGALQRYADPLSIDAVFISHLHADHCLDLCGYYVLRKYHPAGHRGQVPVYGPAGIAGRIERAYDLPAGGMAAEFAFRHLEAHGDVRVGPFLVTPVPVAHPVEAYGFRVAHRGGTVAYTGDTGWCEELVRLADHADVLLAEASFQSGADNPSGVHLTGSECGRLAEAAEAGALVLTHIPPWHDPGAALTEAVREFPGEVALAAPGMVLGSLV